MSIFELSVTGGVLILAVLLVRAVGKKRLPMRTFTVLWHVALLRLFLPVLMMPRMLLTEAPFLIPI